MWCFVYVALGICFAPQQRALFRDANFQGGPSMVCFVHFDLDMCFAPQLRALFQHVNFQKWSDVVPPHPPLYRAYFSTLQSHRSLEKHRESRLSLLFAHLHLLFSLSFFSVIFSLLLFSSLTLPTAVFPSVHIVGSLTSKLPSMNYDLWRMHSRFLTRTKT